MLSTKLSNSALRIPIPSNEDPNNEKSPRKYSILDKDPSELFAKPEVKKLQISFAVIPP